MISGHMVVYTTKAAMVAAVNLNSIKTQTTQALATPIISAYVNYYVNQVHIKTRHYKHPAKHVHRESTVLPKVPIVMIQKAAQQEDIGVEL